MSEAGIKKQLILQGREIARLRAQVEGVPYLEVELDICLWCGEEIDEGRVHRPFLLPGMQLKNRACIRSNKRPPGWKPPPPPPSLWSRCKDSMISIVSRVLT